MARLLYTSDAVVGPPRSTLSILTAPPGTYSYKALADLQDVDGRPVSGGRLTTDQGGSLPDFFGPEGDVATLYALLPDGSTVTLSLAAENASPLTAADARGAFAPITGSANYPSKVAGATEPIAAKWQFSEYPELQGSGGTPLWMRKVGDGLTYKWNSFFDATAGDGFHFTTGPNTRKSRVVADAVTTAGTPILTSATANFNGADTSTDLGIVITGPGIPANTTVVVVIDAHTVQLSQNATATATGVSITIGAGPNANGCVIAIGVDNGATGIITRAKGEGIALHVDCMDTVTDAGAFGCFMYHESHIAPFSKWVMTATATQPMVVMAASGGQTMATGAKWFEVHDNDATYAAGFINADNGKIDWKRTVQAVALAASFTPVLRVADEADTSGLGTETFLTAKTTGGTYSGFAGMVIRRNTTGVASNTGIFGGRIGMDTTNADRLSFEVANGATTRGAETWRKIIAMRGSTGTTGGLGFFGTTPAAQQSITGALSTVTDAAAKAVLTSLVAALANFGLATNGTT